MKVIVTNISQTIPQILWEEWYKRLMKWVLSAEDPKITVQNLSESTNIYTENYYDATVTEWYKLFFKSEVDVPIARIHTKKFIADWVSAEMRVTIF